MKMLSIFSLLLALSTPSLAYSQKTPLLEALQEKAEQGDAEAQFNLGVMYYKG